VLVVDDDVQILRYIRRTLELEGYQTLTAADGRAALEVMERETPNLIILDIMLPEIDGYSVCERIREFSTVPIIMVTAKGQDEEKVKGFELGADDYVTKPFSIVELLARVKAVLRRSRISGEAVAPAIYRGNGLEVNFASRRVAVDGRQVNLTPTEFNLLEELILHRDKALTHSYLLQRVWGPEYRDEKEYLHVFIGRLRAKLHLDPKDQKYIKTIPGVGYQFSG
jgi:DNA-binding response OmpR family regulator